MNKGIIYKNFDFEKNHYETPWGKIGIDTILTKGKKINGIVKWGSPYQLNVWFALTNRDLSCFASIVSIKLYEKKNSSLVFEKVNLSSDFSMGFANQKMAWFPFKGLHLKYVDHYLIMDYKIEGECSNSNKVLRLETDIFTNYSEETVTLWDVLMSV